MAEGKYVGGEHLEEFGPDFHDRLFENWPEPREQLHAGGWRATHTLAAELDIASAGSVLDVCCGEGGTAVWMARELGLRASGVDIVRDAVRVAIERARGARVTELCTFVCANVFALPFPAGSFDIIIGQDPDGFAHRERVYAFKECRRVLRPGGRFGFHHWIPGPDAPGDVTARFDQANVEAGYPSHGAVHADGYVAALQQAGFEDVRVEDMSAVYTNHMRAVRDRARSRSAPLDAWTRTWLELAQAHPFGVKIIAHKPR